VAVIGAGQAGRRELAIAEEIGVRLAARGAVVVCGGLGGVMEAVCRGAKSSGGLTIGILPGITRAEANRWIDAAIPTGLGEARNALVVRSADALIAVGGGFGTLSEIALALKAGKRVVGVGTWTLEAPARARDPIVRARDAGDAVEAALRGAPVAD
jgi:uncharacterized protein (TIGR00725 family)